MFLLLHESNQHSTEGKGEKNWVSLLLMNVMKSHLKLHKQNKFSYQLLLYLLISTTRQSIQLVKSTYTRSQVHANRIFKIKLLSKPCMCEPIKFIADNYLSLPTWLSIHTHTYASTHTPQKTPQRHWF